MIIDKSHGSCYRLSLFCICFGLLVCLQGVRNIWLWDNGNIPNLLSFEHRLQCNSIYSSCDISVRAHSERMSCITRNQARFLGKSLAHMTFHRLTAGIRYSDTLEPDEALPDQETTFASRSQYPFIDLERNREKVLHSYGLRQGRLNFQLQL